MAKNVISKKENYSIILLMLLMFFLSVPCYGQHDNEVHYLSETDETIQLSVLVLDVKEKYANAEACADAVYALIFNGINGSKRRYLPYVNDGKNSYDQHCAYFHELFDCGGFWTYIIASSIMEKGKTQDKKKFFVVNVNVNIKALRASLIEHNVIRRFGV